MSTVIYSFMDGVNMEFEQKPEVLHCYELLSMQYLEQSQDEDIWKMLNLWSQDQVRVC